MHPARTQWLVEMPDELSNLLMDSNQMDSFLSGELRWTPKIGPVVEL